MYQYFLATEKLKATELAQSASNFSKKTRKFIMRFQLFSLFFLVLFLQTALGVSAQQKISLDAQRASLEEVLQQIRRQSGLDYVIQPDHIRKFTPLTLQLKDVEINTLLALCFQGQPVGYQVKNNTIIVTDKQQSRTINGVVTDTNQKPLQGASVRLKGTSNQTKTDEKGMFRLDNVPTTAVLEIRFLGYEVRQIDLSATNARELGPIFILKQQTSTLDEVIVQANTGYQKLDPSKATGSMVVIDEKKIKESPALSLMQRLEGQISGVQFNMKNSRLLVRSPNTYNSNSSGPLIVIDGFPAMQQQLSTTPTGEVNRLNATDYSPTILNNFNPDDIASITVLKDAAAASIWGSRAANGVIVIETKKGRTGRNSINFTSTIGVSAVPNLENLKTMNSANYIDFEKELFENNFFSDPKEAWRYQNISEALTIMFQARRGEISIGERDRQLHELGQLDNRKQIQKNMLQSALTQQYNLSFNGAVQGARYYFSAVHANDQPIYRKNNAKNTSFTFNINNGYFNNKLLVDIGLNHAIQRSTVNDAALAAITPSNFGLRPYQMLKDANGQSISRYYRYKPETIKEMFENNGYLPWSYNHIDELNYNDDNYSVNNTRLTTSLKYRAFTWLNATLSGAYQIGSRQMESLRDRESYFMRNMINEGTTIQNNRLVYGVPMGGRFVTSNTKSDEYSIRFQLDASKTWNSIHKLDLFAGSEIRQTYSMGYAQTRYGFDKDTYTSTPVNPSGSYQTVEGRNQSFNIQDSYINVGKQRFLSYYANGGYTLMDKYFLTGSVRFDDATIIGLERSKRAKPFWSSGLRWDLHKELFMQDYTWLNQLSLRSSIGTGGSVPTQGTSFTLYSPSINDPYTQLPNGNITIPANQMLGWETTRTFNTGLDISLFSNRLNATIDVYRKNSYGIVSNVPYNATYGWANLAFNTSDMKSSGIDLQIYGDIIKKGDWTWESNINLAYSKNEVTDARFPHTNTNPATNTLPLEGYPIDQIFAYRWAGLDNQGRSQIRDLQGNIIDADASTSSFTPEDIRYMGRLTAPYFGGWTNTVSYKNFIFTARITMNFGHKVRWREVNSNNYPTLTGEGSYSGFLPTSEALVGRWRQPGDEANTNIPGIIHTNFNSIDRFQHADINVLDASNIRLQLLSLGYSFPSHLLNQNKVVRSLNLGLTASNLGMIWKKSDLDIDPEYMFDGNYQSMRPTPNFLFTLGIGL